MLIPAAVALFFLCMNGSPVYAEDPQASMSSAAEQTEQQTAASSDMEQTITPSDINREYQQADDALQTELFSGYVDSVFYNGVASDEGISFDASNTARRDNLSEADAYVYSVIYQAACDIANGDRSSSLIVIPIADIEAAAGEMVTTDSEPFSLENVILSLLDDCPYELYWYDKTETTSSGVDGENCVIRMPVSSAYALSGATGTYAADTSVTGAATKSAAYARQIAAQSYGKDLYDALDAYRAWICDNTAYDYSAAATENTTGYGNPWQLIWVFDEDASTKVVCEGYAKAFKYLCDLYANANPDTEMTCYLVEGTVSSSYQSGPHMWNIVRMNNTRNYLVDVTNCDGAGDTRRFFLIGTDKVTKADFQGVQRTTQYAATGRDGTKLTYQYAYHGRSLSLMMYSEDEIGLSAANFDKNDKTDTFRDVRDTGAFYYKPVYSLANAGVTSGTSADYFSPVAPVTRAQFVTFLYKIAGNPAVEEASGFLDIPEGAFYVDAVAWAKETGITSGRTRELFDPNSPVSRAEAVTFLLKYTQEEGSMTTKFEDVHATAYYAGAVGWAVNNGITSGTTETTFSPYETCTRAQAATFIDRTLNRTITP